jgi:superfamily II RNA helicase
MSIIKEVQNLTFLSKYSKLDDFQLDAFKIIDNFDVEPENILISVSTGCGKSLVAEYSIYHTVIHRKKKVIYTSPIKTLSNEKFYDFTQKFSEYNINIGLMTGDIKYNQNGQSDVIIMTTEILLNLLSKYHSQNKYVSDDYIDFNDIGSIIFDEIHYINDENRGYVWEQSLLYIPTNIQIIMLSATLDSPQLFANWVSNIQNKPTKLLMTTKRVVPLYFSAFYALNKSIITKLEKSQNVRTKILKGNKNKQNINQTSQPPKLKWNQLIPLGNTEQNVFNEIAYQNILKCNQYFSKENHNFTYTNVINVMLQTFKESDEEMFPLLFFVLNKRKCIELAKSINFSFNTPKESSDSQHYIQNKIREMNIKYMDQFEQYHVVMELASKGIGFHHSGLLPILKEIIEMLFSQKLIKVLFATETFSIGLNLPLKTTVFTNLSKYSNGTTNFFKSHEFIQMAGRAGRRNIDILGHVILLPQLFKKCPTPNELNSMIKSDGQQIKSKFQIDENLVLRILKLYYFKNFSNNNHVQVDNILTEKHSTPPAKIIPTINMSDLFNHIKMSMLNQQNELQIINQQKIVDELQINYDNMTETDIIQIKKLNHLSNPYFTLNKQQKSEYQILKSDTNLKSNYSLYNKYNNQKEILDNLTTNLKNNLLSMVKKLQTHEFCSITEDGNIILTNKGILGCGITNTNAIPVIDLLLQFKDTDEHNMILLFSTLIFEQNGKKETNKLDNGFEWAHKLNKLLQNYVKLGSYDLLELFNFNYLWLLDEFLISGNYVSYSDDDNYLFEGNFVHSCNRLINLLNEVRSICEETQNFELMAKIQNCIILMSKDWLKPDSIYLHMSGVKMMQK